MNIKSKIYFASDMHFGTPTNEASRLREKKFIQWLDSIKEETAELFLVGDIFDFWFDYDTVVPKGFIRLLGKLAQLSDNGVKIHYFKGNHDMWLDGYFENEMGFKIHSDNYIFSREEKTFFVGHGDGKGPQDFKYKLLKKIFRNSFFIWCFKWIHPDIGMAFAQLLSKRSRYATGEAQLETFKGKEKEWLFQYSEKKLKENSAINYFIFGHRHLDLEIELTSTCKYINLGDWLNYFSYAEFDGEELHLKYYKP